MKTLIDTNLSPIGGWRFEDPDSGYKYSKKYRSFDELATHIARYRAQNGLKPITNIQRVVFDWLCNQPEMETRCCDEKEKKRTWKQLWGGARQALHKMATGKFVSQSIAEKRTKMCLNCLSNIYEKDDDIYYSPVFVFPLTHGRTVENQKKLYTCRECNCILAVKVHHTKEDIIENLEPDVKKKLAKGCMGRDGKAFTCWQIKDIR